MRPKLPPAKRLLPYLARIDDSRIYSNYGPLVLELESRLADHFGAQSRSVVTVANGTLGLTLALLAQGARSGTLCMMPAWTFVASPHAAQLAGLVPFFVDVELTSWALDPQEARRALSMAPGPVGAVMAVAPFGRPVDFAAWDAFRSSTGLPVVIDAAAGFDSVRPAETPAVVSLHATKSLGVGEGGFVLCQDRSIIDGIRARANFGFYGSREARFPSCNAKLSEYHAAVAHAALDEWDQTRREWLAAAARYRERLALSGVARVQDAFGDAWVSSVCVVRLQGHEADWAEQELSKSGIETRRWWGSGAHAHPMALQLPRTPLPVTEQLARSTIGLPLHRDLPLREIDRVVNALRSDA